MSDRDEQLEVMRAMWGEMKTLNARINTLGTDLGARIDTTNARLEELREYVGARIDAMDERMDARFAELKDVVTMGRLDRRRLDLLERRVDALEQRPAKAPRRPRR